MFRTRVHPDCRVAADRACSRERLRVSRRPVKLVPFLATSPEQLCNTFFCN